MCSGPGQLGGGEAAEQTLAQKTTAAASWDCGPGCMAALCMASKSWNMHDDNTFPPLAAMRPALHLPHLRAENWEGTRNESEPRNARLVSWPSMEHRAEEIGSSSNEQACSCSWRRPVQRAAAVSAPQMLGTLISRREVRWGHCHADCTMLPSHSCRGRELQALAAVVERHV